LSDFNIMIIIMLCSIVDCLP